jgi:hypothetical protein
MGWERGSEDDEVQEGQRRHTDVPVGRPGPWVKSACNGKKPNRATKQVIRRGTLGTLWETFIELREDVVKMFIDYAAQNRKGRTLWFMRGPISSNYVETDAREVMFPPETWAYARGLGPHSAESTAPYFFSPKATVSLPKERRGKCKSAPGTIRARTSVGNVHELREDVVIVYGNSSSACPPATGSAA